MKKKIPILQYNLDGSFVKEWDNAHQAERGTGFFYIDILRACKGVYSQACGYIWKFKELCH